LKPRFEDWNLIKAQALITGKVNLINEKLRVEFRLWDVLAGKGHACDWLFKPT
jgi:TolB protein